MAQKSLLRGAGCPSFWFRYVGAPSPGEIRLELASAAEKREAAGWIDADVRADSVLRFLAARFPEVSRDFLRETLPPSAFADVDIDLGSEIGLAAGLAVLKLRGRSTSIDGVRFANFGSESLIVAEVMMALGDALSADAEVLGLAGQDLQRWAEARSKADILPFPADWAASPAQVSDESAFYARRLGQDAEIYRRAACWLRARQVLHAVKGMPEPSSSEWDAAQLPPGLPDAAEVRSLVDGAAPIVEEMPDDFEVNAIIERNIDARLAVFYRGWTIEPKEART
jgi:hypothetical protein